MEAKTFMSIDPTKECESCHRPYSFIRARVTIQNPRRDICLECGRKEENELGYNPTSEVHNGGDR